MFERFTDRARRVVVLAQEEARMLNHDWIGTEHIILGLIHEGEGVAALALEQLGVSLERVRQQVEEIIGQGKNPPQGHIPFTPRAKKVLELSLREALQLGHNYIGTEHILLGLIREGEGVAAQVLVKLGAGLNNVRQQVIQLLSGYAGPEAAGGRYVRTEKAHLSPEIADIDKELSAVRREKDEAIDAQDFERAARLRDREKELLSKRDEKYREMVGETEEVQPRTVRASVQSHVALTARLSRFESAPTCPSCRTSLMETAAYKILEVAEDQATGKRKVLFVYCRSCGITIDDEILPEGS